MLLKSNFQYDHHYPCFFDQKNIFQKKSKLIFLLYLNPTENIQFSKAAIPICVVLQRLLVNIFLAPSFLMVGKQPYN